MEGFTQKGLRGANGDDIDLLLTQTLIARLFLQIGNAASVEPFMEGQQSPPFNLSFSPSHSPRNSRSARSSRNPSPSSESSRRSHFAIPPKALFLESPPDPFASGPPSPAALQFGDHVPWGGGKSSRDDRTEMSLPAGFVVHSKTEEKCVRFKKRERRWRKCVSWFPLTWSSLCSSSEWLTAKQRIQKGYSRLGWITSLLVVGLYVVYSWSRSFTC